MNKCLLTLTIAIISICLYAKPLTLFFTNDSHGAFLPETYKLPTGEITLGGYANLYNLVSAQRDTLKSSLWLDAGDEQTGSAFSSLKYKGAIGGAVVTAFTKMGLDAATLGNHEFDQSFENTMRLIKLAGYPFLSANLEDRFSGKSIARKPYQIFRKGKLRIGVIGLTLTDLDEKVKAGNTERIKILPYKQAVEKYLPELDNKTDLIILLTHDGIEADSLLAAELDNRVDLIVGGHTHAVTHQPLLVNGIYIVQAGSQLIFYGRLDLDVRNDRIANDLSQTECLFPVVETPARHYTDFSDFMNDVTAQIDQDLNRIIGYTPVDWIPDKYKETAASQWQAQALYLNYYEAFSPDIAMLNCGGLRKAIPAGPIRMRDMMEMLPFQNFITFFECYGSDLKPFIEHNLRLMQTKEHDITQCYNLSWKTEAAGDSIQVTDIRVNNVPVVPSRVYRIVSHDYLAGQADKYLLLSPMNVNTTNDLILDVMVKQVEKQLGKKKI